MGIPRYRAQADRNHTAVVHALKAIGCRVQDLSRVGGGCPDLLVSWRGVNVLIEVKDGGKKPSARKLRRNQQDWHNDWLGPVFVVESPSEAAKVMMEVT